MNAPDEYDLQNLTCPTCGGEVYDNTLDPKRGKRPHLRCKDKECKDEQGYTTGVYLSKEQVAEYRRLHNKGGTPQGKPAGQATAPQQQARISQDDFLRVTFEVTEAVLDHLMKFTARVGLEVPHATLVEQACTTMRQGWITHEKGAIRLGPEPAAPPPPEKAYDRYHRALSAADDFMAIGKLSMEIGASAELDGAEKEELGKFAGERSKTLALRDQLPG